MRGWNAARLAGSGSDGETSASIPAPRSGANSQFWGGSPGHNLADVTQSQSGPPEGPWFNELAAFVGPAYWAPHTSRVQAFAAGTEQEVGFLVDSFGLTPGRRVLDVGCGPGRHALALARRGIEVVGIDLSPDFIDLATGWAAAETLPARFHVADVRSLAYDGEFDAVVCLCQGGFGLLGGDDDAAIVARLARALRPGGRLALTAFSSYFVVAHLEPGETFDARTGVLHERTTVRNETGMDREFDLWTTCFTARELRLLAEAVGLVDVSVTSVAPGAYGHDPVTLDRPELLLLAQRP